MLVVLTAVACTTHGATIGRAWLRVLARPAGSFRELTLHALLLHRTVQRSWSPAVGPFACRWPRCCCASSCDGLRRFALTAPMSAAVADEHGREGGVRKLKLTFTKSTDFYGRVTMYALDVRGVLRD